MVLQRGVKPAQVCVTRIRLGNQFVGGLPLSYRVKNNKNLQNNKVIYKTYQCPFHYLSQHQSRSVLQITLSSLVYSSLASLEVRNA